MSDVICGATARKIDGVMMDPTTADPIVTMCMALKLANRAKVAMRIDRGGHRGVTGAAPSHLKARR